MLIPIFATIALGIWISSSFAWQRRVADLKEKNLIVFAVDLQVFLQNGHALYFINFGFGKELWVCLGDPETDPSQRLVKTGRIVEPERSAREVLDQCGITTRDVIVLFYRERTRRA